MAKDIEQMIRDNEKLVYFAIQKYFNGFYDDEDIHQMGMIGLWKACMLYDETKGIKFSTFAVKCIRNEISMEFRYRSKHPVTISLDNPIDAEDDHDKLTFGDQLADLRNPYSEVECDLSIFKDKINSEYLDILQMNLDGMSQVEIAKMRGCTRAAISRIIIDTQKRLRRYIQEEDLI